MKSMRLPIYLLTGLCLLGVIIGTFLDEQLSAAIFSRGNDFGIFVSTIGTMPGYLMFSFLGGGFFFFFNKKQGRVVDQVISLIFAIVLGIGAIYYAGREFFGENGYNKKDLYWIGFLIILPLSIGMEFFGFKVASKSDNPRLWHLYAVMALFIFIALVPGTSILKGIMHRPRYRTLTMYDEVVFHPWYKPCTEYKELMNIGISKEEFKSYPSGHASASLVFALVMSMLPLINKKYQNIAYILFGVGVAWYLLIAFVRILVGAHFLSDVSTGGLITSVCMLANNEIQIWLNKRREQHA